MHWYIKNIANSTLFFRGWKKSLSHSALKKWMSARLIQFFGFLLLLVNKRVTWKERVSASMEIGKKRKSVWRRRIYTKYVSWNRLQKNVERNSNADLVLRRSWGSPGQWFPETEYFCASVIFVVGTSGIPPELNYRSVKSYKCKTSYIIIIFLVLGSIYWSSSLVHFKNFPKYLTRAQPRYLYLWRDYFCQGWFRQVFYFVRENLCSYVRVTILCSCGYIPIL